MNDVDPAASNPAALSDEEWRRRLSPDAYKVLRIAYPQLYWDEVQAATKGFGWDAQLFHALVREESNFNPQIRSHAGACGLSQLMPATAQWMTKSTPGLTTEMAAHLFEPVNCIAFGANYIAQMLRKFDGNMLHATAAYNGGPGNVNKWLKGPAGASPDAFTDLIPLEETKGYVRKVLGNYAAYRSLYP
mgnify:CR=1 FL=1